MNIELLEEIATRAGWAVLHSLWQGALLGLAIAILLLLVRRAATRHALGFLTLLGMAGLLLANIARTPDRPRTVNPVASEVPTSGANAFGPNASAGSDNTPVAVPHLDPAPVASPVVDVEPTTAELPTTTPIGPPVQASQTLADHLRPSIPWVASFWLLGVLLLSLRQCIGWWCVRRWRKEGISPAPSAIAELAGRVASRLNLLRELPVLVSERVAAPLLVGVLKPAVLLPVALVSGLKTGELEAIIAHEFAHFRRRDGWANLVQIGIETLLFYHPAVWWLGRLTRREREHATDDLALRSGTGREVYVSALAAVAEIQHETISAGPALAASGGPVLARIRRLLAPQQSPNRTPPSIAGLASGLAVALVVAAIAIGQMNSSIAQDEEEKKKPGARIEVSPGESIQDAIDAAENGATIVLAEGTYTERVHISKPLTLEGAGWDKTILKPNAPKKGEEARPTLSISRAQGVGVRGLQLSLSTTDQEAASAIVASGRFPSQPIVSINGEAVVSIADSAIIGPSGYGVSIASMSKVKMSKTLVAAVWGWGVSVEGGAEEGRAAQVQMDQCTVRNCYYAGVMIGAHANETVIERSQISGAAWHGIRYDHASPRIERNVIFKNARFGIYANGKTTATVNRNAFVANEMGGISCWFANTDNITANLFSMNKREGVSVVGASTPTVSGNWFMEEAIAVTCGKISGEGAAAQTTGKPLLKDNRFTMTKVILQVDGETTEPPEGNLVADSLGEVKLNTWEYGPIDDVKQSVGYIMPGGIQTLMVSRSWPKLLAEEHTIIPKQDTRDSNEWNKSGVPRGQLAKAGPTKRQRQQMLQKTHAAVKPWIDDAFQLEDVAKREAVIEEIRAALKSKDQDEIRKGLVGFTALGQIRFDKASFHDLFLPLLKSEDPSLRVLAAGSLVMSGIQDGDIDRLVAMTEDEDIEVRKNAGGQLVWALDKDLTGKPGAAILKLLSDPAPDIRRSTIHSLWGAKLSPALEARVIELSREEKIGSFSTNGIAYDALYYALSTLPKKSEAAVKRLIEFLAARDTHNVGGRAAWGLGYGVAKEHQGLVADAALKVVAARSPSYLFKQSMERLEQYATEEQAEGIRTLLEKPGVDGEFRKNLENILVNVTSK